MAKKDVPDKRPPDPANFRLVLLTVVGIALFSAICQIAITALAPVAEWPRFQPLVETFKWGWVTSIGAMVGLMGGKAMR